MSQAPAALLLWALVLLAWAFMHYAVFRSDPTGVQEIGNWEKNTRTGRRRGLLAVRSLILGAFALILAGLSLRSLALAAFSLAMGAALPLGRAPSARKRMGAEWEVIATAVFVIGSAWIIGGAGLELRNPLLDVPLSSGRAAVICFGTSLVLFAGPGGTHVVRGVLDKVGTLPRSSRTEEGSGVDTREYNRGRVIGNLERVLLVATVAVGSYEAMGLIIAAKGLIRIKEFQERSFAEYFLVGTLTSVTVAFVLGWLLRTAVAAYW